MIFYKKSNTSLLHLLHSSTALCIYNLCNIFTPKAANRSIFTSPIKFSVRVLRNKTLLLSLVLFLYHSDLANKLVASGSRQENGLSCLGTAFAAQVRKEEADYEDNVNILAKRFIAFPYSPNSNSHVSGCSQSKQNVPGSH
jgi:hypothetical protein